MGHGPGRLPPSRGLFLALSLYHGMNIYASTFCKFSVLFSTNFPLFLHYCAAVGGCFGGPGATAPEAAAVLIRRAAGPKIIMQALQLQTLPRALSVITCCMYHCMIALCPAV